MIVLPPKCIIPPKRRVEKRQMPIEGVKCHIHTIECHLTFRTNISLFNLHDVLINNNNNKAARCKQIGTAEELLLDRYRINEEARIVWRLVVGVKSKVTILTAIKH